MHTLRYAARAQAITHTVRRNVLQSPLSAHDASFLRAENQRLKARLDQYEVGVQMAEFSSLQSKLFKAEQEAQRAREHAKSVRRTADKWKEQFEKIKVARAVRSERVIGRRDDLLWFAFEANILLLWCRK